MKTAALALFLALALGAGDAFVVSPNADMARGTTFAVQMSSNPVNGGRDGSTLVPGQYDRISFTLEKDLSQGGQIRQPQQRVTVLPKVTAPNAALIQTTGGLEVSSKMTTLSPMESLALASARTLGHSGATYRAPENLAPPAIAMEKDILETITFDKARVPALTAAPPAPAAPALGAAPPMPAQQMGAAPSFPYQQSAPAPVAYTFAGN